jgi:hypothetical protein
VLQEGGSQGTDLLGECVRRHGDDQGLRGWSEEQLSRVQGRMAVEDGVPQRPKEGPSAACCEYSGSAANRSCTVVCTVTDTPERASQRDCLPPLTSAYSCMSMLAPATFTIVYAYLRERCEACRQQWQ